MQSEVEMFIDRIRSGEFRVELNAAKPKPPEWTSRSIHQLADEQISLLATVIPEFRQKRFPMPITRRPTESIRKATSLPL